MQIYKPNYTNGSIVNLMSSISKSMGYTSAYNPLPSLDIDELSDRKNIILLVLDGLGYDFLMEYGNKSFFNEHLFDKITSVFPPTTSAAITSFLTGVAPQQHAVTGWFMYLKELGVASKILPFGPKYGGHSFDKFEIEVSDIIDQQSIFEKINRESYYITPSSIKNTPQTQNATRGSHRYGYNTLNGFIWQIKKVLNLNQEKKYIYAYWSEFDHICHDKGTFSNEVQQHFWQLNDSISDFVNNFDFEDTVILITADHGMMDSQHKTIHMKDHPELKKCLTLPLCGEPRAAYCYVHPSKTDDFEQYVQTEMNEYCSLHKSQALIDEQFFGLFAQNPKLFDRIGDYTLLMKDDYIIKHYVLGESEYTLIGNHGGVSKREMEVPLVKINRW